MKKTYELDEGRIFDLHFWRDGQHLIEVTVYEVKRPHRKHFGRTKFFPFCSAYRWIDDFERIEDLLLDVLAHGLQDEEDQLARDKKVEEFFK